MTKVIQIRPPTRGVFRATTLEGQPDGTCIDAKDVLPVDYKTGYERLAVRPGWVDLGQDATNLIATLNVAPAETYDRLLVTAKAGELYTWNGETGTVVSGGVQLKTGETLHAAPYIQELFFANHDLTVKKFSSGALSTWTATSGTVPTGCTLICEWANRIVMSGVPASPHVWYMSRIGDPYDWLYAVDDPGSPVAATDIDGGQIGEPITSLIPHNRDCIIFGTANSMTVLRGNPAASGHMEKISYVSGPVSSCAWCRTPDDWTYMLTRDGLYKMPPGCGTTPVPVSNQIPDELKGINGIDTKAYLAYDVRFRLVHIYLQGASSNEAWFYDVAREGFWPQTPPGTAIKAIGRFDPLETEDESGVLVATAEGVMRLDRTVALAGATATAKLGPFPLAPLGMKQLIQRAVVKMGSNTNDAATLALYGAESAEAVIALPAGRKSTMTAAKLASNHMTWLARVGGHSGLLSITQADATKHWSFEGATLYVIPAGKER